MNPYNTSFIQQQFWFLQQRDITSPAFNVPADFLITGDLDVDRLKAALGNIVITEPQLRVYFEERDTQLHQILVPEIDLPFEIVDFSEENQSMHSSDKFENYKIDFITRPFILQTIPLFRCALIKTGFFQYRLLIVFHHTIADLSSLDIFVQKLSELYNHPTSEIKKPDKPGFYIEYSEEKFNKYKTDFYEKDLSFWQKSLKSQSGLLNLKREKEKYDFYHGFAFTVELPEELTRRLHSYSKENHWFIHIPLISAFLILLHKYSGQNDITIGYPFPNRLTDSARTTLGAFANNLPLPIMINPNFSYNQITNEVRQQILLCGRHQQIPLQLILGRIQNHSNHQYNPLFQTAFTFEPEIILAFEGCECQYKSCFRGAPQLDLFSVFRRENDRLKCRFEYSNNCFSEKEIKEFSDNYIHLLNNALENNEMPISSQSLSVKRNAAKICNVLSTYTIEPIQKTLEFWKEYICLHWHIEIAPYNQIFQELLNPHSNTNRRTIICMIFLRLIDFGENQIAIENQINELLKALKTSLTFCPGSFYIFFSPSTINGETFIWNDLEKYYADTINNIPGCHAFTSESFRQYYTDNYYLPQADIIGHIPYRSGFFLAMGTYGMRTCMMQFRKPYKVIVIDCDNTLWQGVSAEDGALGVRITPEFRFIQNFLLAQKKKGMVLALCSKNVESDIWAVFDKNQDMLLIKRDITFYKINWEPKYQNLKQLAAEINVGLDSFIYIDDNPLECSEMRIKLPQVLTIELPEDTKSFQTILSHIWAFDKISVTDEDERRTNFYKMEAERLLMKNETHSFGEFLKNLNLQIDIEKASIQDISRLSQLAYRTNQFNSSLLRLNEEQLYSLISNQTKDIFKIKVSDRFGEYGTVGVVILSKSESSLIVENFSLSCRVLGRGVEHQILQYIGNLSQSIHVKQIEIMTVDGPRNLPFRNFVQNLNGKTKSSSDYTIHIITTEQAITARYEPDENPDMILEQSSEIFVSPKTQNHLLCDIQIKETAILSANPLIIKQRIKPSGFTENAEDRKAVSTNLEKRISAVWQEVLNMQDIGINENFFELGGNSILIPEIILNLKEKENIHLQIVDMFQYPTIQSLAAFIDGKSNNPEILDQLSRRIVRQKHALQMQKLKSINARTIKS